MEYPSIPNSTKASSKTPRQLIPMIADPARYYLNIQVPEAELFDRNPYSFERVLIDTNNGDSSDDDIEYDKSIFVEDYNSDDEGIFSIVSQLQSKKRISNQFQSGHPILGRFRFLLMTLVCNTTGGKLEVFVCFRTGHQ